MDVTTKVTMTDDVALPVVEVMLKHLKTKTGAPVVVLCEATDEFAVWRAVERLPGGTGAVRTLAATGENVSDEERIEQVRRLKEIAPPLIEAGTALLKADGTYARPAFYFGDGPPPYEGCIPGRLLRVADLNELVLAILTVGGYAGGAAEALSFPMGDGSGRGDGAGVVDAGEGDGPQPVASGA